MIRVLRVIEYTYQTPERMTHDMLGWQHSGRYGGPMGAMSFRSTHLDPTWEVTDDEAERRTD